MNATKYVTLDLVCDSPKNFLGKAAVEGDENTRTLGIRIRENGIPWPVPDGVSASLEFTTAWGSDGWYDTMPDGSDACELQGDTVFVRLHPAITSGRGFVTMALVLQDEDLGQISTFPFRMKIVGKHGKKTKIENYYKIRNLEDLNLALQQIRQQIQAVDTAANRTASEEARYAAEEAKYALQQARILAESLDSMKLSQRIDEKGDDLYLENGKLYLVSGDTKLGEGVELPGGGVGFESWAYDPETKYLHIYDAEGKDVLEPVYIPGGGGAASVMMLTTSLENQEISILDKAEHCEIPFSWSSLVDGASTGSGFMEWTVGGSRAALVAVEQGDRSFDIRPYLADGAANEVVLKVTDVYGVSRTLSFVVTVLSYGLSWNLGELGTHGTSGLTVRLTPTGSGEKVLKVAVDGSVVSETTVSTSGRTSTVTVPAQTHGSHTVTAWVEVTLENDTLITDALKHVGVWLGDGVVTPVVGVMDPEMTVRQYGTAAVRWFVVDPASETATVNLKVGEETVSVLEHVGREIQTWYYKAPQAGELTLTIESGTGSANVCLTVEDLGYDVQPVTAGLQLDLDPAGHSNAEANRESFGYLDGDGVNHPLTFSDNFDWTNGGFRTDEEGVTAFVVKRGCYVTLDRGFFDTDCRTTGRNIKLIFASRNVRSYDAELLSCKSGNVGMVVQAQKATVSSQLETMTVPYYEGRKIEMNLCIDAETEDSLAWIDLKAIQSCPPVKYGDTDSWAQSNPVPLTIGSEDADVWIYRMKLWDISLNRHEVLDEHICCAGTPEEMAERYLRNDIYNDDGSISLSKLSKANPKLRVIHIRARRMTTGKEDEVVCDIEILYEAGGQAHHLIICNAVIKAQGTSSLEYILAALNLDADLAAEGCTIVNGLGETVTEYAMTDASIPVSYFNLKANVASSESANNVCLADEYNLWNPYICAPRAADSRVRDTVEGHPCAVFFTSTADAAIEVGARMVQPGETILYFVGDMNNSKKNFAVFGQDNSVYPKQCCVEVMNNTELPCRFKEEIADSETWKDGNFEFRFPKNPTDEMKQAFMAMQRWVVSTDRSAATNEALAVPAAYDGVAYAGDTAEYRAAKFRAEFGSYFVPEAMDFHYLFTDENCMTDNRAKNLFFCYEYVEDLDDYRWSVRCDYDNDTGLGNDNSGGLTFRYGLEDTDMVGDSWVFNAHDSVLWCNIRDLRSEELRSLHTVLAGQGAWDPQRRSKKWREYQSAVCEALRAEDMHNKYFLPWLLKDGAAYTQKCYGTKDEQRDQFFYYQQPYKASQYIDVTNRSDAISMRSTIDTAQAGNLTLTGYSDMYFVVMYGNGGTVKVRGKRGEPTLIECPTDSLGDTETYIFSASNLSAISSLAGLKPKFVLATTARRLQELIVGSGESGYQNLNLSQIGVGSNEMLRILNVQGCPKLVTALDLTALTSLEKFLANGSGITGVSFAKGAPLTEVRLPAVSSLVAQDLHSIETFLMDSSALTLLRVEDCPGIDTLAMCKGAAGLERGRLTGVSWTDSDARTLLRLAGLKGYDSQGKPADKFVLTGSAHVASIIQEQIDAITAAFPELVLTYDAIVPSVTVTFADWDDTVLNVQVIPSGTDAVNPITAGYISEPERESDVEYHYTFNGWDRSYANVTEDITVKAAYASSDRYYRVTFWADEAESAKLQEWHVIAHDACGYLGEDLKKEGQLWIGWDQETTDVVCDLDVHAVFLTPTLPDAVPDEYDYLWSNDPADSCRFTAEEFYGILYYDRVRDYFALGDRIRIKCNTANFKDSEIILTLRSFKHFMSAEQEGKWAGPYFGMVGVMNAARTVNDTNSNAGGYPAMTMPDFLEDVVYAGLPQVFREMIEKIVVLSSAGETSADIVSVDAHLTLESQAELGFNAGEVPYCNEVAEGTDEVTFSCYTSTTSRVKKRYNGTGSADYYWLRSPVASSSANFWRVTIHGGSDNMAASLGYCVSFGFCLRSGEGTEVSA